MSETFEHKVIIWGAYDGRKAKSNYGISSMMMQIAVIGPAGATSANISLPWYTPNVVQEGKLDALYSSRSRYLPDFWDIGYHRREPGTGTCHLLGPDCSCNYDGSALAGNERWREGFLHGGTEWLFKKLEEYYYHVFNDAPYPDLTPIPRKFD